MILLYLTNVVCSSGQSVLTKQYAAKGGKSTPFNYCRALSALIVFTVIAVLSGFNMNLPTLFFGALYGLMLCGSMYTGFKALSLGPVSLTSTIASFSLIVPVLFGICFLRESLSVLGILGIALLLVSIVLINYKKGGTISFKWSVFSLLTLIFNGFCSVIQKLHQIRFPKLYQNEFMVWVMLTVFVVLQGVMIVSKEKYGKSTFSLYGLVAGVMNGGANYIVLYLAAFENATVLFPIVSAANTVAVWLMGRIVFKEKLNVKGIVGILLGITAVLMLKLG